MGWHLIEWLDRAAPPTVVWKDGAARQWAQLGLIERRDGICKADLERLVDAALRLPADRFQDRELTPLLSSRINGRQGPRNLQVHHVVGPDEMVVGLLLWIGRIDEPVTARPRAAGVRFHPESRRMETGADGWMLHASNLDRMGNARPADSLVNRVVYVPHVGELVDLCASRAPVITDLQTEVSLVHEDLRLVNVAAAVRRRGNQVWWIGMDITRWSPPPTSPELALRLSGLPSPAARGILTFRDDPESVPSVLFWVSEPPQWTAYWSEGSPQPDGLGTLLHREDRAALLEARDRIDSGIVSVATTVRVRRRDQGWQTVEATLSRFPSVNPNVFIIEITGD
ncbi:hypothetical protein ACFQNE_02585 [Gordonia phosphorivorans]|uniref:Rv3651-like N-terminal domain-containing protein n=1 Tax=Gordonia phosphorivorans TaxID=1056982 RepID=A0ABV6H503_9ACTN